MKILRFSLLAALCSPLACVESAPGDGPEAERGPIGKADLIGSCALEDCDGPSSSGNCWCDDACAAFGDCCADKEAVCDAPCQPDDCGEAPVFVHCADGVSIAAADVCTTLEDGACGWTAACALPEPEACTPADCGEAPVFVHCADGVSIAAADVCTTLEDGACGWTAACALPEPEACTPADCGEAPVFVHCADGVSISTADVCTTLEDGACGWTAACALP